MIITTIDGINLYSTPQEAINEAIDYGLIGYHTHVFEGVTGYMAGFTHSGILKALGSSVFQTQQTQPIQQPIQPVQVQQPIQPTQTQQPQVPTPVPTPVPTVTTTTTTSSSPSGGGGY